MAGITGSMDYITIVTGETNPPAISGLVHYEVLLEGLTHHQVVLSGEVEDGFLEFSPNWSLVVDKSSNQIVDKNGKNIYKII